MKTTASFIFLLILIFAPNTRAQTKNNINVQTDSENSNIKVQIDNQLNINNNSQTTGSNSTHINISQSQGDTEVSINNNDFKISGRVDSVSAEEFTIANQKIIKDNLSSSENSLIVAGNVLKISGTIKSGLLYGTNIELIKSNSTTTLQPTSSNTIEPSATPSPTPNTTSPTPKDSTLNNVRISISGPVEHLGQFLQQIIKFFQNLAN